MENKTTKPNAVNEALQLPLGDAFDADFASALKQAEGESTVTLAMLDMDGLLAINASFGHEGGDQVLIQTGRYLAENTPKDARLYRYAGDCFAIIFPLGIEKEQAFLALEALRAGYSVSTPDGAPVTLSIGLACYPEDGVVVNELVRKADGAMFRAKLGGRNRICLAREEKMVTKTSHYTTEQLQRLSKLSKREGIGEAILLREALDALLKKYDV